MRTKADRWLAHQPLWLYAAIAFAVGFGIWAAAVYAGAWASGGVRAGDGGFDHGTFSFSHALIVAAMLMVLFVGVRWRQQGRNYIFWVLGLAAIVVGGLLVAVTPA